jgi:hypothetical protein
MAAHNPDSPPATLSIEFDCTAHREKTCHLRRFTKHYSMCTQHALSFHKFLTLHGSVSGMQAWAFPMLYDQTYQGCKIPSQAYKAHKAPTPAPAITIEIKDKTGKLAKTWASGGTYMLAVTAYGAAPVNVWLHSDTGQSLCLHSYEKRVTPKMLVNWYRPINFC